MVETINFVGGSGDLHRPAGSAPLGLIAVVYGSQGLADPWGEMIRGYAEALAEKGFLAFVPAYLGAVPPHLETVVASIPAQRSKWQKLISDGIDKVQADSGVAALPVGLLGFSLGGHLCLRLRSRASVLVAFFAPLLPLLGGLGAAGTLTQAQIHHGENDQLVDFGENAPPIRAILKAEGTETEFCAYKGASHGFAQPHADDAEARTLSMTRTLAFFATHLR